ncbi:hypothetical protein [Acholeplasma granularum]|uniref:hypothetical protein n=1 Tax=Acholeplasma granularum TaxID=264635 RepID=UPI000472ED66|nr:hypothetical protein [Acholeplasma granularum]
MIALSNMNRLQVSTDLLLLLLKVYEAKGKDFYYDELFSKDKDVFLKKTIEKNVFYFAKILKMPLTDARLKLISTKKLVAKNKTESLLINIKDALSSIQKHPKEFELMTNEFDNLIRMLSKDYEPIKFNTTLVKKDGTLFATKKTNGKKDELDQIIEVYNKQNKTKQYELTQLISNFYVDFINNNLFTSSTEIIAYIGLYAMILRDFSVFKYFSFFELFYKKFEQYELAINQANYYYNTGYPNTDMLSKFLLDIFDTAYEQVNDYSREYSFEIKLNKSDNIEASIRNGKEIFSKAELRRLHPTVSVITIDRTLKRLKDEGIIQVLGKGRSSKWQRVDEDKRRGGRQLDIFHFTDAL